MAYPLRRLAYPLKIVTYPSLQESSSHYGDRAAYLSPRRPPWNNERGRSPPPEPRYQSACPTPPLMRVGNQNMARTGPRQVGPPGPVQENMGNQAPTAGNGRGMGPPSTNFRPKRGCYVCGRYGCHSVQGRIQELSKGGADGERGGSASL